MEWYQDETLWRELFPYVFPLERMASAAAQVEHIIALTGVTGGAVLDLCCGPGRHAVEFAQQGFAVTGVDASLFLLKQAIMKAAGTVVEWVHSDMREFRREASFDLACNLFTSFGYSSDEEENLRVLRNLFDSLRQGGTLVMDMVGREHMIARGLQPRHTRFADGAVLIQQPLPNADWTRLENEWTVARADGSRRVFRFSHHLYSGEELRASLSACGFQAVRLYGNLGGAAYTSSAPRLVAVAQKG